MGKKVKKKIKNTQQKDKKDNIVVESNEVVDDVAVVEEEKRTTSVCKHIEYGVVLEKISEKISSRSADKCDDCREGASERKGRSKHGKKGAGSVGKKKDSKSVWVCLQCGHFSCGGVGMPTIPQCHAIGHNKKTRHPYVIQLQNPNLCYCFPCNSLIQIGKLEQEDGGENNNNNNVLVEIGKLIKAGPGEGSSSIDVEDIWFGSGNVGGGGAAAATSSAMTESSVSDRKEGYVVRGLSNLGNTCFFNSVMQNLLAVNQLRSYFLNLDCSFGPLNMALKKLLADTSVEANSKYGVCPRNLFGSICAKAPQFKGYQQQDSHELLRCLLDGLSTEEIKFKKSVVKSKEEGSATSAGPTFVETIFGGQLSSTVSCVVCGHTSIVHEPFLDLSLPLPTKKSTLIKAPLVSRYKKAKPPLKYEARKGKLRGKGKTNSVPVPVLIPSATSSSKTEVSSSLASPPLPVEEGKMCSSLASSSAPCENEKVDSSLASSSIPLQEEKMDSADNDCWLDYLGEDMSSCALDSVSPNNDISTIQISENKNSEGDGVVQCSSESQNQVLSQSTEQEKNLELPTGDDLPLLQGSEVLLLPYKDESVVTGETVSKECEVSSSFMDYEQGVEFEGLGDLFYEPEIASVPNSDDKVKQVSLVAAVSSESDPDEVDNRDAPVSVSSCLAWFIKPELLSGEHAWHCENCSKTLHGPQLQSREYQSETAVESKSIENGYLEMGVGSTVKGDEDLHSTSSAQAVLPITTDCKSNCEASSSEQANRSCSVNDFDSSNSKAKTPELDGSDGGDGKIVKVMRDATKRILINKAPPILTIHLKRFSQDVRGRLSKLTGHVAFQDKINLNPYMSPRPSEENKCEYDLIGVVEHAGTMRSGHYIAYVRGERRKDKTEQDIERHTWYYASDSHVRTVSIAEVFRSEAYILFYERV